MIKVKQSPMPLQKQTMDSQAIEKKMRSAAEMYEKHFLNEMVKAMRGTVSHSGLIQQNMAEKIFSEKLDNEYVDSWGTQGGIGLADVIYKQVMERFGQQLGLGPQSLGRPQGPVSLEKSGMQVIPKPEAASGVMDFAVKKVQGVEGVQPVLNPWPGILMEARLLEDGQAVGKIKHDQGLVSELVFKGGFSEGTQLQVGEHIPAGKTLGLLGPEADSVFWRVRPASIYE